MVAGGLAVAAPTQKRRLLLLLVTLALRVRRRRWHWGGRGRRRSAAAGAGGRPQPWYGLIGACLWVVVQLHRCGPCNCRGGPFEAAAVTFFVFGFSTDPTVHLHEPLD